MPDMRNPSKLEIHESSWAEFKKMLDDAPAVTDKTKSWMVKLGEFDGSRGANSLTAIWGLEGDYDGGVVQPAKARQMLQEAGIEAVVITTWNHTPNRPRWRVFTELDSPIKPNERAPLMDHLNKALGGILSPESWVPSQCYFIGRNANHPDYYESLESTGQKLVPTEFSQELPAFEDLDNRPKHTERIETDILIDTLSSGEDVHNSARTIIARLVRLGLGRAEMQLVKEALTERILKSRGENRSIEFGKEFERMFNGAIEKGFSVHKAGPFTPTRFSYHDAIRTSMTPIVQVENMYYSNLGQLIGAGGQGKSTLVLYELMMAALGRDVHGNKTTKPQISVVITAEDEDHMWAARLARLCDGNFLTQQEADQVFSRISFHYVGEINARLTQVANDTVEISAWTDDVIESLDGLQPDIVVFDPAVSFGVGETRVNDAEQGLVMAARRLIGGLGCSVNYIHHTGKGNARERATDQYAGRGGSALSDGSRVVRVLNTYFPNKKEDIEEWLKLTGHRLEGEQSGMRISTPKLTYGSPPPDVFIIRTGWRLEHIQPMSKEEVEYEIEKAQLENSQRFYDWLVAEDSQGRQWSKRQLLRLDQADRVRIMGEISRNQLESMIDRMVANVELQIKDESGNKTRLVPVHRPDMDL